MPEPPYYRGGVFKWIAPVYDAAFAFLFFFLGGRRRVRQGLVDFGRPQAGMRVLDIACGTGALSALIAKRVGPGGQVVGVDLSASMIKVARRRTKQMPWLSFEQANTESLPFPDCSFDEVFASYALHEMPDEPRARTLAEIARVLKPGGSLVVLDFSLPNKGVSRWLMRRFVGLVEEKPGKKMLEEGSLFPSVERSHFDIIRMEYLLHGASVMVHAEKGQSDKR